MRQPARRLSDQSGVSIMEVLFAMAIFAIGILAVHSMQINSTRYARIANDRTQGNAVAQRQIENLVRLAFNDPLLADTGYDSSTEDDSASVPQQVVRGPFTIMWHVDVNPAGAVANTATIRVDVWHVNNDDAPVAMMWFVKGRDVRI